MSELRVSDVTAAYESFARVGENMTNAAMAIYAFDQIDRARAALLRAN